MLNANAVISSAQGDDLIDAAGRRYFDLCMGYGSVCFGHSYGPVVRAQQAQLAAYASPGFVGSSIYERAAGEIKSLLPDFTLHGFYTSGTDGVEIAIKMAMHATGRRRVVSFQNSMHGRTMLANALGFETAAPLPEHVCKLPFGPGVAEESVLDACAKAFASGDIAAVIVEPVQMSAGGFKASDSFYHRLQNLAEHAQVLQIYDEILTGFFRSGSALLGVERGLRPDIVVAGKAAGAGFPMSMVLQASSLVIPDGFRAKGTYFNHPMISASVAAMLTAARHEGVIQKVAAIEHCVTTLLPKERLGGKGAMWNISFRTQADCDAAVRRLADANVIVSYYANNIRFLPSFRVDLDRLRSVCKIVVECL